MSPFTAYTDAAMSGSRPGFAALSTPKPVRNGDTFESPCGKLSTTRRGRR